MACGERRARLSRPDGRTRRPPPAPPRTAPTYRGEDEAAAGPVVLQLLQRQAELGQQRQAEPVHRRLLQPHHRHACGKGRVRARRRLAAPLRRRTTHPRARPAPPVPGWPRSSRASAPQGRPGESAGAKRPRQARPPGPPAVPLASPPPSCSGLTCHPPQGRPAERTRGRGFSGAPEHARAATLSGHVPVTHLRAGSQRLFPEVLARPVGVRPGARRDGDHPEQ